MAKKQHLGDWGHTGDFNNCPLPKNSKIINALGNIDELIAHLGLIRFVLKNQPNIILPIQQQLQSYSAYLAGYPHLENILNVSTLECEIENLEKITPKQTSFYLPGDKEIPTIINICRTVCRRAERSVVNLQPPQPIIIQFLNRLSDYLFTLQIHQHYRK